jgi:hypothetical protein
MEKIQIHSKPQSRVSILGGTLPAHFLDIRNIICNKLRPSVDFVPNPFFGMGCGFCRTSIYIATWSYPRRKFSTVVKLFENWNVIKLRRWTDLTINKRKLWFINITSNLGLHYQSKDRFRKLAGYPVDRETIRFSLLRFLVRFSSSDGCEGVDELWSFWVYVP